MRLQGKVAVITGAGSGMGRASAKLFAAEGAMVVAGEWNETTLAEVVDEVRTAGGEITGVKVNVADRAQAESMIDKAVDSYGRLDILYNNAGVMDQNQPIGTLDDDIYRRVMSINVDGPAFATRKAIPVMVAQGGGSIINTASVAGVSGAAAGVAYTMSKHALIGLTRSVAFQYAMQGIRCNAIIAGAVETHIMNSVDPTKMDPEGSARFNLFYQLIPATLQATDIANLALFLASDDAAKINGALIPADGGWTAA